MCVWSQPTRQAFFLPPLICIKRMNIGLDEVLFRVIILVTVAAYKALNLSPAFCPAHTGWHVSVKPS